jgi:hypothetical protein
VTKAFEKALMGEFLKKSMEMRLSCSANYFENSEIFSEVAEADQHFESTL